MFQEPQQTINWTAVNVGVMIVSSVMIAVGTYLRMFVKGELVAMEKNILIHIETKFSSKELVAEKLTNIERRIHNVETLMETIRLRKAHEEGRHET